MAKKKRTKKETYTIRERLAREEAAWEHRDALLEGYVNQAADGIECVITDTPITGRRHGIRQVLWSMASQIHKLFKDSEKGRLTAGAKDHKPEVLP